MKCVKRLIHTDLLVFGATHVGKDESMPLESDFQSMLIAELEELFPGAIITKLDTSHIQGIPDLLILFGDRWAVLECKKTKTARHQPNQDYYVDLLNSMSYAAFIYPENKRTILHEIQQALAPSW